MQKCKKMMLSPMLADVVAFLRCNCPTLVLLRWDVVMPGLDLMIVIVVDDSTNHAKYADDATFLLVDALDDAMSDLVDVAVLLLSDVMVLVLL